MEIELKKLYQHESRVGTFCVGQRNPRAPHANFGCNRCSICDEQKRIKGGHFVGQNLRRGVKGKFVCDDCRKKDGDLPARVRTPALQDVRRREALAG